MADLKIDPARSRPMGRGFVGVVARDEDGGEVLLLMDQRQRDGCLSCVPIPEHEQVGPLPLWITVRIFPMPRCGAPTRSGEPCRNLVDEDAHRCYHHGQG
jgi:hypothetical protein